MDYNNFIPDYCFYDFGLSCSRHNTTVACRISWYQTKFLVFFHLLNTGSFINSIPLHPFVVIGWLYQILQWLSLKPESLFEFPTLGKKHDHTTLRTQKSHRMEDIKFLKISLFKIRIKKILLFFTNMLKAYHFLFIYWFVFLIICEFFNSIIQF